LIANYGHHFIFKAIKKVTKMGDLEEYSLMILINKTFKTYHAGKILRGIALFVLELGYLLQ